ncbi:MAG: hypothetical protein JWP51_3806 [Bradyrhizobium sp.]|jgi:hypothetical protein|nr:hypothetical protein [Bradyrhizobium sp.]
MERGRTPDALVYGFLKESKNRGGCALETPGRWERQPPCDRGGVKASRSEMGSFSDVGRRNGDVRFTR